MTSDTMIIAVLVARLGGKVEITADEMHAFLRPTMTQFMDPRRNALVIEVEMPAIDAVFEVIS